ncbi:hypothetical protein M422DRAFT_52774 [Sphaerobolus stellatus SS14]|uniref:Asparagine synthetase domain-containing protein n=1 Tax=Sphaerobolus stellatus (strain SS14) TaxID=990650 RepID=A0A0C9UTR6_SPHS4|nr:hypothetical protein M422DRAFT_52774 [Sphaerobolus stellatus SS14]
MEDFERAFNTAWLDALDPSSSQPSNLTFMQVSCFVGQFSHEPDSGTGCTFFTSRSCNDNRLFGFRMEQIYGKYNYLYRLQRLLNILVKTYSYWSPYPLISGPRIKSPNNSATITYEEAKTTIRRLLTAAVKRRLVSDREICIYLSGGIDSTVVCALVKELGHPLTCLTLGFGNEESVLSEEALATKSAKYYELSHLCRRYTLDDTINLLEKALYHTEIPIVNPHCIAKYCLSEFAQEKNFAVVLTGEGADEILLGYVHFRMDLILELRSKGEEAILTADTLQERIQKKELPSIILGPMPERLPLVRGVPSWQAWHHNRMKKVCHQLKGLWAGEFSDSLDDYAAEAPPRISSVRLAQIDWLKHSRKLNNYLIPCLGDRVEMASSIEGRPPMLDKDFTEFALQLPQEYLLDPETLREKKILYEAFEDIVPPHIRTRSKQPFWAPSFQECLTKTVEGKLLINKYLLKEAIDRAGVWSHAKIQNLLERLQVEEFDAFMDSVFGVVLSVQILHSLFIENTLVGNPDFPMVDRTPKC